MYSGNRYRFQFVLSTWNMESRDVQSILGRYRVGEPVMIAVNPGNASDSVLESGIDFESLFPLAAAVVLVLVGLGNFSEAAAAAEMRSSGRPRYRTAGGIALTAIALFTLSAYDLWHGMMSLAWPSVPGRMLYSHARQGSRPETLLWYEYNVNNRRYVASNYRNGGNATPFDSVAEVAAQRYPAGGAVTVCYNPNDPEDALRERGIWWRIFCVRRGVAAAVRVGMAHQAVCGERGGRESRWRATSPMWNAGLFAANDMFCMTATRSSVAESQASCATEAWNP